MSSRKQKTLLAYEKEILLGSVHEHSKPLNKKNHTFHPDYIRKIFRDN